MPNEATNPAMFADPSTAFAAQSAKLARRRALAESLVRAGMSQDIGQGYRGGKVFIVGNPLGNVAQAVGGQYVGNDVDQQQAQLNAQDAAARRQFLTDNGMENLAAGDNTSLRGVIEKQVGQQLDYPRQREIEAARLASEQARIEAQDKRQTALFGQQAELLDKRLQSQKDLKGMPSIIIHQGGGRGAAAGSGATGADGKPLTAAQEKAALELGSNRSNLQMLTDTFKDDYAGDLRSTVQRKFGEAVGGMAPKATQEMTRWWANQAMFDELPQRHELFGATLTTGEKAAWASAAISPNMAPDQIRERLAIRSKIYDDAEERMRGSAVAGGRSGRQFDAAVGKSKQPSPTKSSPTKPAEERKTIGGKNYIKRGGDWYAE